MAANVLLLQLMCTMYFSLLFNLLQCAARKTKFNYYFRTTASSKNNFAFIQRVINMSCYDKSDPAD